MKFFLKIVTPDRVFFEDQIDRLIARGVEGDFAVLPNMSPFVTKLDIGLINILNDGVKKQASINGGYIDVRDNKVLIVTSSSEWPEEIDENRAKQAMQRAQDRLKQPDKYDTLRAEIALKKSINRLKLKK